MKLLADSVFQSPKYDPQLLNSLAATRWRHWGIQETLRVDYPIHENVSRMQAKILDQLLSSLTLTRLQDGEVKVPATEDAYTMAEHLKLLTEAIFAEVQNPPAGEFTNRSPYVSSYRRNLQRAAMKRLADLVLKSDGQPEDARVLLRVNLGDVAQKIDTTLNKGDLKLDDYSRAHLADSRLRLKQVLEAESEDFSKPISVRVSVPSTRVRSDADPRKASLGNQLLEP